MSISGALTSALSGLTASSRAAELVSSNIANAMTEGYGRREIDLSSRVSGGNGAGVRVDGVTRVVNEGVIQDRRAAEAGTENAAVSLGFYEDLQALIGVPEEPGSLGKLLSDFEGALIEAASRPDVSARLEAVVRTAGDLTTGMNRASNGIQQLRVDADKEISSTIDRLNADLDQIAQVNSMILKAQGNGRDVSSLLDQRQALVDDVAKEIPLRVYNRENGTIALYSTTGALLLDTKPARFDFTPSPTITPDMTLESGALSGIFLDGRQISTGGKYAAIGDGRLSALFSVRDETSVLAQSRLDSVARDLIERVTSTSVDPTLAPGDPGFFTDAGLAFNPSDEVGVAGRISVNAIVDPSRGGDLWRLRDGLAAPLPGPVGGNAGLVALRDSMLAMRVPASGDVAVAARSASALISDLASRVGGDIGSTESRLGYSTALLDELRSAEFAAGVDTDQELQKLLLVEKSFAANARVIQTADEMIQLLLGI